MNKIAERFRFAVDDGNTGRAGDVSLTVTILPNSGDCLVAWGAGEQIPSEVQEFITRYATEQVELYVKLNPELGLKVVITGVGIDPVRHNEYDRATFNAIRLAVVKLKLPDLLRYQQPTAEELAEDGLV